MDKKRIRNKSLSDNRSKSQKEAAQKRLQTWKPGQSGNPAGAPKRGESWKEIVAKIGNMTPREAADHCNEIAKQIRKIGDGITLKEAVVLRVYTALLFEPQPGLLNAIMERDEGKVTQPISGPENGPIKFEDVKSSLFGKLVEVSIEDPTNPVP
ncbi:MAG TPA: hypothetical protein VII92_06895 [Anaerolineae bacterium]